MPSGVVIRRKNIAITVKARGRVRPWKDLISSITPVWQIGVIIISTRKDWTGTRFGKLVVEKMIYGEVVHGRKRTQCLCRCDCGNTVIKKLDSLRTNAWLSCGCDYENNMVEKHKKFRKDLTGKRFGRLTVLKMDWERYPTKARCICDCGNELMVTAADLSIGHTQSCGCLQSERASVSNLKDWSGIISPWGVKFIDRDYVNKRGVWMWKCSCPICQTTFTALPAKVMNGSVTSCGCKIMSSGEQLIKKILDDAQVENMAQYVIPECRKKNVLRFDFALFHNGKLDYLIEYDGKQHYEPIDWFGGEEHFKLTQERDAIKNSYCEDHNIPLLRLPYTLSNEEIRQKIEDIIYP